MKIVDLGPTWTTEKDPQETSKKKKKKSKG
jgi:hypothetical protein